MPSHTLRQLKLIVPGGAIAYHFGTLQDFWTVVQSGSGLGRRVFKYFRPYRVSDILF